MASSNLSSRCAAVWRPPQSPAFSAGIGQGLSGYPPRHQACFADTAKKKPTPETSMKAWRARRAGGAVAALVAE